MLLAQRAIGAVGLLLVALAALGAFTRGRCRLWWTFALYLIAVTVCTALPALWPRIFFNPDFWQAKETVYALLRFAMACEVGMRTLRAFPGAFATARRLVLLILLITLVAVVLSPSAPDLPGFVGELQPRILNGSAWMLIAIGAVILWYRIPIHPFHKAILLSYIPYILASTVLSIALVAREFRGPVQYFNQLAYVALVAYWNHVIWRRDRPVLRAMRPAAQSDAA